jgi:hypothetical protein
LVAHFQSVLPAYESKIPTKLQQGLFGVAYQFRLQFPFRERLGQRQKIKGIWVFETLPGQVRWRVGKELPKVVCGIFLLCAVGS